MSSREQSDDRPLLPGASGRLVASVTPREIADAVFALTTIELVELNAILAEEGGSGPISVREPRNPTPPADGARAEAEPPGLAVAHPERPGAEAEWPAPANLPEDYWETAQ